MTETLVFKTSPAALEERRQLIRDLRFGLALALILLCQALGAAPLAIRLIAWLLTGLLIWGFWQLDGEGLLAAYASREMRFQGANLELIRGRFTRLLFFDQLEQLRMIQSQDEKVLALELRTLDGAVTLSGYENMEALFGAISTRKPARVMVEVEEKRFDTTSPRFWSKASFIAGAALLLLFLLFSPGDGFLKPLSGLLLIALALFVAVYQPFSHLKGKRAAIAEVAMGVVFLLFGVLLLG